MTKISPYTHCPLCNLELVSINEVTSFSTLHCPNLNRVRLYSELPHFKVFRIQNNDPQHEFTFSNVTIMWVPYFVKYKDIHHSSMYRIFDNLTHKCIHMEYDVELEVATKYAQKMYKLKAFI